MVTFSPLYRLPLSREFIGSDSHHESRFYFLDYHRSRRWLVGGCVAEGRWFWRSHGYSPRYRGRVRWRLDGRDSRHPRGWRLDRFLAYRDGRRRARAAGIATYQESLSGSRHQGHGPRTRWVSIDIYAYRHPRHLRAELMIVDRKAIREVIREYVLAWNQGDVDAVDTLFDIRASYVSVLGILSTGRLEIAAAHRWMLDGILRDTLLPIHEASLTLGVHGYATYRGRWELAPHPGESTMIRPIAGMFLSTLRRVDGEWPVTSAQTTTYFTPSCPNNPPGTQ